MNSKDPLSSIVVSKVKKENRAKMLLSDILTGYIEIEEGGGDFDILQKTYKLSSQDIILILLCGKLAQKFLQKIPSVKKDEKLSQQEIIELLSTLSPGTIKASLSRLREKRLITNDGKKNYVEISQLQRIKTKIVKYKNGNKG